MSADGFGYTSGGATTWLYTQMAGQELANLPRGRVMVDNSWDAITFTGWFQNLGFDITSVRSVGLRLGSEDFLIPANPAADNAYDVDQLADAENPVWYQAGLVAIVGDARRFYIEVPTSQIPDGCTEVNVIIEATDGTVYTMNSWGAFQLAKNADIPAYDYVDEHGTQYTVVNPSTNQEDLYVDGKNTGLYTVYNTNGIWARSKYGSGNLDNSLSVADTAVTGKNDGAPFYFEVKDAEGNPMADAVILLKNRFGIVTRAETNANGMAVGYTTSQWEVSYEVEDTEYTGTAVPGVFNMNKIGGPVEDEPVVPAIDSAAIELGETISVHYYATVEGTLVVTMMDAVVELTGVYNDEMGMYDYVFTNILPQEMAENISAKLVVDEVVVDTEDTFSVAAYLTDLYNTVADEELKALAAAALEYGVAAQAYLGYEGTAITAIDGSGYEVISVSADNYFKTENAQYIKAAGVRYDYGCNGLYFKLNVVDGMAVTLNGEAVTPVDGMVRIPLSVLELNDLYTLEVTVGETVETIVYSVEIYAARMSVNEDANAALAAALCTYGAAAQAYVD